MLLVFLTDFGTKDGFAGVMKGVALSINPKLTLVDLSHEVDSFNILEGALILKAHYRYFPKGTIFVAVVDPGVGTERKAVAIKTENYYFVAPMNGLLDLVLKEEKPLRVVQLENPKYRLKMVNNTFHGRDIFTPAAAYISLGVPLSEFGRTIKYRFTLNFPKVRRRKGEVVGEIVYFDKFGNAVTNIPCGRFKACKFRTYKANYVNSFLAGKRNKPNATCGSFGFVELFLPMDNFREKFGVKEGERVVCLK